MHLTAKALTIIGIPLGVISVVITGFWLLYYGAQAGANLKPDSKWRGLNRRSSFLVPRSEFTELGLWYRRRLFIMTVVFVACGVLIASYWGFAVWLAS